MLAFIFWISSFINHFGFNCPNKNEEFIYNDLFDISVYVLDHLMIS